MGFKCYAAVALLVAVLAIDVNATCHDMECPTSGGYFAHPQSCLQYVKCVGGKSYIEHCPANLHYNAMSGMCDHPHASQCVQAQKEKSNSCKLVLMPTFRSAPAPGVTCDCGECCRKPHPTDCSSFYQCDENGNAYEKTCSEGLVYNPVKEDCDLPSNYECPKIPECNCKCRYPVDGECDAFYRCEEIGAPISKEYCTEGLIFNPETQMCDFPKNVDCPKKPTATTVAPPQDCKDKKTDCKYWVANGDCNCDPFYNGDCSWQHYVKENCPASCNFCNGELPDVGPGDKSSEEHGVDGTIDGCVIDCSKGQYHRHPTNCEMFIQCAPYGPQEMPCPKGTRWDQDILTCNHASSTPCVTGSYVDVNGKPCGAAVGGGNSGESTSVEESSSSESKSEEDSNSSGKSSEENGVDGTIDGCVIDCSKGQYHRHPTNCEMFIQCAPYGPQEMPCPKGTRWDQDILTCNHASSTPCVTGSYVDVNGKPCGGHHTTDKPPSGDCVIVCPQPNGAFAHPRDCKKWIHCSNNTPYVKDCPAGLYFDAVTRACNWPENTVCIADEEAECGVPIVPGPTGDPVIPPEVCDCECCLRPHPEDCQSYYYCDGSSTEFHTCSEGLVFHPVNETCVFADSYPQCQIEKEPVCECECLYPSAICSEYFKCVNEKPIKLECQNGLHFNPIIHACDNPENVDCTSSVRQRRAYRGHLTATILPGDCSRLPNGRYPAKERESFYHCANGVAFLLRCQKDSVFNSSTSKCTKL